MNDFYLLLVFLHLAFLFVAVSMSFGAQLLLFAAIRSNRSETVLGVTSSTLLVGAIVPILYAAGAVSGLAAAWVGGFPLLAPWLVISYVAFVILAISGVALTGPNYQRLRASLVGADDGTVSPDARKVIASPAFRGGVVLDFALLGLLVADMVFKPFS